MKRYIVLDTGKPAKYEQGQHEHWQDWSSNEFDTFEEADRYAYAWIGDDFATLVFRVNEKVFYAGEENYIEIREVEQ